MIKFEVQKEVQNNTIIVKCGLDRVELFHDKREFKERVEYTIASRIADEVMKQLGPAISKAIEEFGKTSTITPSPSDDSPQNVSLCPRS